MILPVAPSAAGVIGVLTAVMFALLPTGLLEQMVVDSGVAAIVSAAEPPLGVTARAALALVIGGGVALVAWFALFLMFGSRSIALQRAGEDDQAAPVLRRADAHPDAPPRRPLFANRDLGTPFLDVRARPVHVTAEVVMPPPEPVERDLPDDLDQPLAAFDPGAVPDEAIDWFPPPAQLTPTAPRRPTFAPSERMETFALSPAARSAPEPEPAPLPIARPAFREDWASKADPSDTIHALLDRLERSVGRREDPPAPPARAPAPEPSEQKLEDTLSTLRKLATRIGG